MPKPETTFKMGAVRASVFCNILQRNGQTAFLRKVALEVRYRDKHGQWQSTNTLSVNDLPKAIAALQQAYEYVLGKSAVSPQPHDAQGAEPPNTSRHAPGWKHS